MYLLTFVKPQKDWVDIFMIIAIVLALVAAFLHIQARALASGLTCLAIAAIAAGLLFIT